MRNLDANFIEQKNALTKKPIYLYTVYEYNGVNNLYFAAYAEDVTFAGIKYTRFPITHEAIGENVNGEINTVQITLSGVSLLIRSYLKNYDFHRKKVSIKQVFQDTLGDSNAYKEDIFYIDSYKSDYEQVSFTLSTRVDILCAKIPGQVYTRNSCIWLKTTGFKGAQCGYTGEETTCNGTLARCKELGNSSRYGAFPSIPAEGFAV